MDLAGPVPKNDLKEALMARSNVTELPEPFGLRKDPGKTKKTSFDLKPKPSPQSFVFLVLFLVLEALGFKKHKEQTSRFGRWAAEDIQM